MKLLKFKNFFESKTDIIDFCNMYLTYLKDVCDFELSITEHDDTTYLVTIKFNDPEFIRYTGSNKNKLSNKNKITWANIKDDIIPFIQVLDKKFSIKGIYSYDKPSLHFKCYRNSSNSISDYYNTHYTVGELSKDDKLRRIGEGVRLICISAYITKR